MRPLQALARLWHNPGFQAELREGGRRPWMRSLVTANAVYAVLFVAARYLSSAPGHSDGRQHLSAQFNEAPWLALGAILLSLSAHWLLPPSVLPLARRRYDLGVLTAMVRDRRSAEELLRGQVAGRVGPLLAAALPLALALPLLVWGSWSRAIPAAAGVGGALLWAALATAVSLWSGLTAISPRRALRRTYTLICLVLPAASTLVAVVLAHGCTAGRHDREIAFPAIGALTWAILVVGIAAVFWDQASARLFPEKHFGLWGGPTAQSGSALES